MLRSFFNEFKKFAMRGNVIDMAVGIIIGAAFGKIVDSLVKDIIMPPIGLLIGSMDFSNLFFVLKDVPGHHGAYASLAQAAQAGATTLNVGNFLNAVISFTIVAFAVFLLNTQTAYASGISESKLAKGTEKLIGDATTWLMVLAPVVAGLLIIYFCIRRSAADEMDQKKWNNRIVVAIVSCIGAVIGSATLNIIIGYYQ